MFSQPNEGEGGEGGTYGIGQAKVVLAGEVKHPVEAFAGAAMRFRESEGLRASC